MLTVGADSGLGVVDAGVDDGSTSSEETSEGSFGIIGASDGGVIIEEVPTVKLDEVMLCLSFSLFFPCKYKSNMIVAKSAAVNEAIIYIKTVLLFKKSPPIIYDNDYKGSCQLQIRFSLHSVLL